MTATNTTVLVKDSWKYCPQCGSQSQQPGQHPFRCTDCGYTHYFSPCTAVGALIVDSQSRMLFIVRGSAPGKGKLGLPGGFVDAGETAEKALVRELVEELSLEVVGYRYLASFPNSYAYNGIVTPVTDLFFVAEVASLESIQAQPGEVDDWLFQSADKVDPRELAFDTHRLALEAFLESGT